MDSGNATVIAALIGGVSSVIVAVIANRPKRDSQDFQKYRTDFGAPQINESSSYAQHRDASSSSVARFFLILLYISTALLGAIMVFAFITIGKDFLIGPAFLLIVGLFLAFLYLSFDLRGRLNR